MNQFRNRVKLTLLIFTLICIGTFQNVFAEGYQIDIQVNGFTDADVILGHYLNKSMYPDDTVRLDGKGKGTLKGKEPLPQGLYILFMPDTRFIQVVIGEDQQFSISTDSSDYHGLTEFKGSIENSVFHDFQKYMAEKKSEVDRLKELYDESDDADEKKKLSEQMQQFADARKEKIETIHQQHPDLFVSTFLMATLEVEVPDPPKDENGHILDSNFQYNYYKNHFFDNFDLSDARLLRTPLYEDRMMRYLEKVVPQIPDSLITAVDMIVEKSRADSSLFRYVLITIFNHYGKSNIMGMDAIQVHVAEKYYIPESWWSDEKYIEELKERVTILKPILLGKTAPDFKMRVVSADHFKMAANDTALKKFPHAGFFMNIHQVPADYTVLIFWEASCSHCKKVVPQLHKTYTDTLKHMGVEVMAISTMFGEDGKEKWVDFVNKNKLYEWINAWNPYDYQFKIAYDVRTTPQVFILDKEKKIIGKRLGVEQVADFIQTHQNVFANNK